MHRYMYTVQIHFMAFNFALEFSRFFIQLLFSLVHGLKEKNLIKFTYLFF